MVLWAIRHRPGVILSQASRPLPALLAFPPVRMGRGRMGLGLRSDFASKVNIAAVCAALAFVGLIVMGIF